MQSKTYQSHYQLFKELKNQVKANIEADQSSNPFMNAVTFLKKNTTPSKLELMADYYRNFHESPEFN